ncbi:hypothetical protein CW696_02750 [ANME-2 cluster archaeon]|nr:MAG: hypothetical protein CW696_02750 [ANME-2 cluster archaeon]
MISSPGNQRAPARSRSIQIDPCSGSDLALRTGRPIPRCVGALVLLIQQCSLQDAREQAFIRSRFVVVVGLWLSMLVVLFGLVSL